jgi:hypothetical protein
MLSDTNYTYFFHFFQTATELTPSTSTECNVLNFEEDVAALVSNPLVHIQLLYNTLLDNIIIC